MTTAQQHQNLPAPTRTVRLSGSSVAEKRAELLAYYTQTWELYESLFDCLADERAWFTKAITLRHPLIFYFGHTASFYINKLMAGRYIDARVDDRIEAMMAIGVDEMSWDDLDESHYAWPSVQEVRDYLSNGLSRSRSGQPVRRRDAYATRCRPTAWSPCLAAS